MGQSNSNESIKPEHIHDTNKWTNYMEWTNFKDLKEGEKYKLTFESVEFELIFCYYAYRGKYGYCENCDAVFKEELELSKSWVYNTADDSFEYYRFISRKEYESKIRDKYDEKVLNIVLKKIVNDDFKW